jgi:hypothetical protein
MFSETSVRTRATRYKVPGFVYNTECWFEVDRPLCRCARSVDRRLRLTTSCPQVVNSGDAATFNCSVAGAPVESVWWLRNAEPVMPASESEAPSGARMRLLSQQVLRVTGVSRSDRGMYQCFVRNDRESAQGSAELRLGGECFPSVLCFLCQDLVTHRTGVP